MKPYIAHRGDEGRVTDRATGRLLGFVGQHDVDDLGGGLAGLWTAWAPWKNLTSQEWDEGLGANADETQHEAVMANLYSPEDLRPGTARRACMSCATPRHTLVSDQRECPSCETEAQAEARDRGENPTWWEHYDWLVGRAKQQHATIGL